jgi:predicted GNAT superfamily acetyltransferase
MSSSSAGPPADLAGSAAALARAAELKAGVAIDVVEEVDRLHDLTRVIDAVWHREGEAVSVELLRALAHTGSCVLGSWSGAELVGASVAFRGLYGGRPCLHSHITCVVPDLQLRGAGYALKLRQRAWALANGIDTITWTFDPLVARNGHFNLTKLGAGADEYLVDFYGPLRDEVNAGDATDRLLAVWRLASPRVARTLSGEVRVPGAEELRRQGDPVVLDVGPDGRPVRAGVAEGARAARTLLRIPDDIGALRSSDPARAASWRNAAREVMTALFASGLRPLASAGPGWYVFGPAGSEWPS